MPFHDNRDSSSIHFGDRKLRLWGVNKIAQNHEDGKHRYMIWK